MHPENTLHCLRVSPVALNILILAIFKIVPMKDLKNVSLLNIQIELSFIFLATSFFTVHPHRAYPYRLNQENRTVKLVPLFYSSVCLVLCIEFVAL